MIYFMIMVASILMLSVFSSKLLYKFGVPTLLIFILLGMVFGSDGVVGIYFNDYKLSKDICSFGLVFIMFYGGFCTNWKIAKPVASQAILMSTLGVVITALLTGLFCFKVLDISLLQGILIGSVIASTDAASVFAILRSRKLNLKNGLASLLEIESGSNDPVAYMMTVIFVAIIKMSSNTMIILLIIKQIIFAVIIGSLLAILTVYILRHINLEIDGLYPILVTAVVVFAYSFCEYIGGNGYLCIYILGIILGNSKLIHKKSLIHFFDGISWLMQIIIFFTLGLLSYPSKLATVALVGVLISLFIIFIARPTATFMILSFYKRPIKEKLFVSWVGLRGAASIVFAIYVATQNVLLDNDIFHIVFFVALFSVSLQGTLIPFIAKKLNLVEGNSTIYKTFNDYYGDNNAKLIEIILGCDSKLINKTILDANIPEDILVVMIKRKGEVIVPNELTIIKEGDTLLLIGENFENLK